MNDSEKTYIGTKLKFAVDLKADGFSMIEDNFEIDVIRGPHALHFNKSDLIVDESDKYYLCVDTTSLGAGLLTAKITAYVPDTDYAGGIRTEVQRIDLLTIKS